VDRIKVLGTNHTAALSTRGANAGPVGLAARVVPSDAALAGVFDLKAIARRAAREAERRALAEVLERVRWNRTMAARILKVSYKTLLSKLTECGLTPPKAPPPT
jgi:DNA-binding NtrC family response regulator